jgi:endonuclease G
MVSLLLALALSSSASFASADFPAPRLRDGSLALRNTATAESYNRSHKQADWVFYPLGARELEACTNRGNAFRPDPRLAPGDSAALADYKDSGYDRGHLSPAGDNKWSQAAMNESFLLTNVSPQPAAFNRGIWSRLEGLVRAWASAKGGLWVATGPVLSGSLRAIGAGRVSVPDYFFKVIATKSGQHHDAVAFVLPTDAAGDLGRYEMSVKKAEEITGLDFLAGLPDEDAAESRVDASLWNLHATFRYLPCGGGKPGPFEWAFSGPR